MAPWVCLTAAATPEFLAAPVPVGHLTSLSEPIEDFQLGLTSDRKVVKPAVVPEESERCTTVMAVLGSFNPGLSLVIAGSFQVLILPLKMSAVVGPSSLRPLLMPGRL